MKKPSKNNQLEGFRAKILVLAILLIGVFLVNFSSAELLQNLGNSTTDNSISALGVSSSYQNSAFNFTTRNSVIIIDTIQFYNSFIQGAPNGTMAMFYHQNSSFRINGTIVGGQVTNSINMLTTGYKNLTLNSPVRLEANTTYWVLFNISTVSASHYIRFGETTATGASIWAAGASPTTLVYNLAAGAGNQVITANVKLYGTTLKTINLTSPENNSAFLFTTPIVFNWTSISSSSAWVNTSLYLNGILNETISISGTTNTTTTTKLFSGIGDYNWTIISCTSSECVTSSPSYFTLREVGQNSVTYEGFVFDTQKKSFAINLTSAATISSISGILEYNNTNYTMTNAGSVLNPLFNVTIDMPLVYTAAAQTKNFKYYITYFSSLSGTNTINTTTYSQIVNATNFSICDGSLTTKFLNISFADEANSTKLNASIPTSTFTYYLGDGTTYKTLTYSSNVGNFNYTFCASPNNQTLNVVPYVSYKLGTAYPQRTWNPSVQSYPFSNYNQTLLLLNTADGLYVTFQAVDSADSTLSGVVITAESYIGEVYTLVAQGTTGSDGAVTFWLNPDYQHRVNATKSGYDSQSVLITPTQDGYTFNMGGGVSATSYDYLKGIIYSVKPTITYLENNTLYSFNLTISSTYWNLTNYGFNITNSAGTTYGGNWGTTGTGGTENLDVNTGTNTSFCLNYFWTINSTNVTGSRCWLILNTAGNTYSISNLFRHLIAYINLGFLGIGEFEIGIICFLIILLVTGTLKMKLGISDEAALCGIIFGIVALLDVSFGFIPNPLNAVPHFPTILVALIFVGFITKEAFQ